MQIICSECGWTGGGGDLPHKGIYPEEIVFECPQCGTGLGTAEIVTDIPIIPAEQLIV